MKRHKYILLLMIILIIPTTGFAKVGIKMKETPMFKVERQGGSHRYSQHHAFEFAWGGRICYAMPIGDWNDHPFEMVDMFDGGLGFDVEIGGWQDQIGYFISFGGNRFGTSDYEQFVTTEPGQSLESDAGMLDLRFDLKSRISTTGPVTPILKAGFGYYFADSNTKYRTEDHFYRYSYLTDNWGFNVGVEVMMKNQQGPRMYFSFDFIDVFNSMQYGTDNNDVMMFKFGVGVLFVE